MFLNKIVSELGFNYTEEQLKDWVWKHLKSGQVRMCLLIALRFYRKSFCSSALSPLEWSLKGFADGGI